MIIGEIRRYLRDNNSIRVSRSMKDTAYKALQVRERLTAENSQEPTIAEIAKEVGVDKEEIIFALESIQEPVSLFEPIYNDGGDALYVVDQVRDEKNIDEKWIEKITLEDSINNLSEREKQIVDMRFYKGKTQMEVADEIGISQAQVSRLEKLSTEPVEEGIQNFIICHKLVFVNLRNVQRSFFVSWDGDITHIKNLLILIIL